MDDERILFADSPVLTRRQALRSGLLLLAGPLLLRRAAGSESTPVLQAFAPKRIYIAPDDHTDYVWKDDEEVYRQAFLEMIDYYLDLADTTAGNPAPFQSRWNCDGSFWLWVYERNRTAAQFARLIGRLKDGHFSAPLTALVSCYGGTPAEAVLRGMYYAGQIERRHGLRFSLAVAMENQTLPYGLGALWAGAGATYTWRGVCACATRVSGLTQRDNEIYWWVGPDGSRMLMKWNSQFLGTSEAIGGYAEARDPASAVEFADTNSAFQTRYPYRVIGMFGKGWDDLKTLTDEFVTVAQQKTNATRSVIVSNELDFFADFEATYGADLPTQSLTYGNEWDTYCASLAEVSARVKRGIERLRTAEALATLVSLQNLSFMNDRAQARDEAWMALGLYWEHNWTADGPIPKAERAAWQRKIANSFTSYVEALHSDALAALGGLIARSGANQRFAVFNPLSWERNDIADLPYTGELPARAVDVTTGAEVPSQIVTLDGQQRLRIWAAQVPAVGYRVYEVQAAAPASQFDAAATVTGSVIENGFYRITAAANGAITSLIDTQRSGREFARTISGRAINDLGPGSGTVQAEHVGPVSATLRIDSSGPLAHTTRITLIRDSRRIEIRNDITQNFGDLRTWSFAFNLDAPDVWYEEVGAVIRARLANDGGQYAARNARYDWLTLNHFADMSGSDSVGVTLSNADCYFMQLGNSTPDTLDTTTPRLAPLVGGQVDGATLGIDNQGGDSAFLQRFALQTHGTFDKVAAMRFALEHQNPLAASAVTGGAAYPATTYSLLTISDPNLLLWALKPADDGADQGLVARLWNLGTSSSSGMLQLAPGAITQAQQTTHIETPIADAQIVGGALVTALSAQQIGTYLLRLQPGPPATPTATSDAPTATPTEILPPCCDPTATPTSNQLPGGQSMTITPTTSGPVATGSPATPVSRVLLPLIKQLQSGSTPCNCYRGKDNGLRSKNGRKR